MDLDTEICRRARLAHDARFDGRFFAGVKSTGIYCRPVRPARPARELRKLAGAASAAPPGEHLLLLLYRPPLDWAALLDFLRLRAIPNLEEVTADSYRRVVFLKGMQGRLEARVAGNAVRKAMTLTAKQLQSRSQAWRPWRVYAAIYLWQVEE